MLEPVHVHVESQLRGRVAGRPAMLQVAEVVDAGQP